MLSIGNSVALMALVAWPLVIIVMFRAMSLERALIWSVLGGYLFLPQLSEVNFPGIPAFNKVSIPNLTAFFVITAILGKLPGLMPKAWPGRLLVVALVLSPAVTVLTNLEPIRFGVQSYGSFAVMDPSALVRAELPGLRAYDSLAALVGQFIFLLPFFLAREFLRSEAAIRELLRALVVAIMIYSLPMLFEVRFSPQLHTWIYGFFQHDFGQTIRFGGFRPIVFTPHGLWLALFTFKALLASVALTIMAPPERKGRMLAISLFVVLLLILCRSMGPIVLALALLPPLIFAPRRVHLLIGLAVAVLVLAYPVLRGAGVIPTDALLALVERIDGDRAGSLGFRFRNEDLILAHVAEKPLFGWGGWGRFMPHDPLTGANYVVVDGHWIIVIGQYGWLGYLALFGLLVLPLISLWRQSRRAMAPEIPFAVSALVLVYAGNLIDLLPNATLIPFSLLIGGALLGHAEVVQRGEEKPAPRQIQHERPPRAVLGAVGAGRDNAAGQPGVTRDRRSVL